MNRFGHARRCFTGGCCERDAELLASLGCIGYGKCQHAGHGVGLAGSGAAKNHGKSISEDPDRCLQLLGLVCVRKQCASKDLQWW